MENSFVKVVLISGKQGAGKTTLQEELANQWTALTGKLAIRLNFADVLYAMHDEVLNILHHYWPKRNLVKDGPLLQLIGTEWGRNTIDQDIWVKCLRKKIDIHYKGCREPQLILVGDCRFENEFDAFPEALRVRLECHKDVRKARCSAWRDRDDHPSEVGLDIYSAEDKFDVYYYSQSETPADAATRVMRALQTNFESVRPDKVAGRRAKEECDRLARYLSNRLRQIEEEYGHGANFKWTYDKEGKKCLEVSEVLPLVAPSDELVARARAEVPDIMAAAEKEINSEGVAGDTSGT
jgi:hypothetical protein